MAIGFLKEASPSAVLRIPPHLKLRPILVLDLELVDGARARGLLRRGQDLSEQLASEIYVPSSVVGLWSHFGQIGSGDAGGRCDRTPHPILLCLPMSLQVIHGEHGEVFTLKKNL
jgi:hypothetical protein